MSRHLAIDLGAESGRVILGELREGRLALQEIHRFPNQVLRQDGTLRWDIDALWAEIRAGLRKAARLGASSIGVDSWALDYVFLRGGERLPRLPFCYRDARTEKPYATVRAEIGDKRIYDTTGIQFMPINSLYQLVADREAADAPLAEADRFLMIGDWFHYLLTGRVAQEESNASTTQLWNPERREWAWELIDVLGLPRNAFPEVVPPCTRLGVVRRALQEELGLGEMDVIAGCVHDTGAAVAAVPASGDDWAYISSGTWSLVGVELARPLISEQAWTANFTNETGVGGTSRFLRNASGMWLLQECRRAWATEGYEISYAALSDLAAVEPPLRSIVNPDHPAFLRPAHMPSALAEYCRQTRQPVPETPGEFARCIVDSLALLYASILEQLTRVTGHRIAIVHIVGGGSQNALLNQAAANATGRAVIAGPVEATATGNVLLQALTLGEVGSLEELRRVARESFPLQKFEPQSTEAWASAKNRFHSLPRA